MKKIITIITLAFSLGANAQNIYTIAGNGSNTYSGDGGQATAAGFNAGISVAIDAVGNLYIADIQDSRIRKVNTAGIASTFAGNGTGGYSGDGGQATAAEISGPIGVSLDGSGNIYISDSGNGCVRKISTAGIISTVAGTGMQGYSGDGGQATAAKLSGPHAVAFDAQSNMYIVDQDNNRIRMVNTAGIISTFAGNGTAGYSGDGGQVTAAEINYSSWICFDAAGNLYIADSNNERMRIITTAGIISTFAGNGTQGYTGNGGQATAAEMSNPAGAAVDASGNLYVVESQSNIIRKINTSGIISIIAGNGTIGYSGDGGSATAAELKEPAGVVLDAAGNVYIADFQNGRIRVVAVPLTITATTNTICSGNTTTLTATGATNYTWSPSTGLSTNTGSLVAASPTVTTTYTVVSTLYSLPIDTTTITITVNALPTVSVTVNTATVCAGTMDTLTASGTVTSYTWNTTATTASITPSPTVTTTYTVMGTDANNCMNWETATINVNALPILSITATAGYSVCPNTLDTLKASGTATSYIWNTTHAVTDYTVHPFNTTTYTLTGVGADGCKNTMIQVITVYPRPTLTVTASSGTVCTGSPTTLSTVTGSVAVTSYSWSTSATTTSITATPTITTTYSVTGTSAEGCLTTKHYTVVVNSLPTITASTDTSIICINGTAILTAGGATTYIWNTSAITAIIPVTLTVTTSYTVEGTDGNGCENMATVTQSVSTTCYEGIERYSNSNNVSVYPNPNNGNFVITTSENTSTISVTDILGKELVSINPKGNTTNNINLSAQPSGVYFIKVIANGAQTVKRIIINN